MREQHRQAAGPFAGYVGMKRAHSFVLFAVVTSVGPLPVLAFVDQIIMSPANTPTAPFRASAATPNAPRADFRLGWKAKADAEAAFRRATDTQVLERLIGAWNERQAARMPMLSARQIRAANEGRAVDHTPELKKL